MLPLTNFIPSLIFLLASNPDSQSIILTSRIVAAKCLVPVSDGKQSTSVFPLQRLENSREYQDLEQRDRSFARALVTTTERRMGQIDKIIDFCCEKPSSRTTTSSASTATNTSTLTSTSTTSKRKVARPKLEDLLVNATLRIGIAQLLFLNVPHHAAVKETVDILRSTSTKVSESKIKFVNAVLRRVSRHGDTLLTQHTKAMDNVAPWLLEQWKQDWGEERAIQISEAFMTESPVHLSVKYPNGQIKAEERNSIRQEVVDAMGGTTRILPNGSIRVGDEMGGLITQWPLYDKGIWWVQDVSASLPALALYSAHDPTTVANLQVVDMCAAPGGKTAQLVSLGYGKVTAIEASEKRTVRWKKNLMRLGMIDQCSVCIADGTEWTPSAKNNKNDDNDNKPIAGVLLDVPCSATGTGSKRPDVMRRPSHDSIMELLRTQELLANHCADSIVPPGGILVYATCSILKEESENQVQKLLSRSGGSNSRAQMETVPFQIGEIPGFDDCIDDNGWMRVLPGSLVNSSIGPCDGFFVARLRRLQ